MCTWTTKTLPLAGLLLATGLILPGSARGDVVVAVEYRSWRLPDSTQWYWSDSAGAVDAGTRTYHDSKKIATWNSLDGKYVHEGQSFTVGSYRSISEALGPTKEARDNAYKGFVEAAKASPRDDALIERWHKYYLGLDEAYKILIKLAGEPLP